MHIPDGFLDVKTAVATGALALAGLGVALRQVGRSLPRARMPLLGLSAAFVFAAQMLNFPVAGGTSGHLIGGLLTAALLGPSAAVIVVSSVLFVQCFLFADGGITTLGANIFNMALIGGVGGWVIYRLFSRMCAGLTGKLIGAALAAWTSTVVASIVCAGELAASHTITWRLVFPAMAGVHALIGVGEAIITVLVLSAIAKTRPELLESSSSSTPDFGQERIGPLIAFGLLISLGLALFVAPFASPLPDGLDKTARALGFGSKAAETPALPAPIVDYKMPGISSEAIATAIAGVAGTVVVFGLAWMLAGSIARRPKALPANDP